MIMCQAEERVAHQMRHRLAAIYAKEEYLQSRLNLETLNLLHQIVDDFDWLLAQDQRTKTVAMSRSVEEVMWEEPNQ